jgi:glycosyltransferase involved in cell wall biosynthesis
MSMDAIINRNNYSVRVLPMYPLSVTLGGFERMAIETTGALQRLGIHIDYLDWTSPDNQYDLLHLFGPAAYWYDIVRQAHNRYKIVLSTIAGAHGRFLRYSTISKLFSWISHYFKQQTIYGQYREALQWADRVICSNGIEGQFFKNVYGVHEKKLSIIPSGVANQFFTPNPDVFFSKYNRRGYVLFVGNIVERKNPLLLAKVLKRMRVPGVFIGGVISSELEYARQFRQLVESASNLLWIENLGYNDPLLASAYSNAAVFCLPSIAETQPLSAMEAMAAQLPVILGDLPYAHQPPFEKVLRYKPNNIFTLEETLGLALGQPDMYRQKLSDHYTWDAVACKISHLYDEIMSARI